MWNYFLSPADIKVVFASLMPNIKGFHHFVKEIIYRVDNRVLLCLKGRDVDLQFTHLKNLFYEIS